MAALNCGIVTFHKHQRDGSAPRSRWWRRRRILQMSQIVTLEVNMIGHLYLCLGLAAAAAYTMRMYLLSLFACAAAVSSLTTAPMAPTCSALQPEVSRLSLHRIARLLCFPKSTVSALGRLSLEGLCLIGSIGGEGGQVQSRTAVRDAGMLAGFVGLPPPCLLERCLPAGCWMHMSNYPDATGQDSHASRETSGTMERLRGDAMREDWCAAAGET
ncbi:uncharacterized protein ColSpa_05877 [Colletotrichum spaethianum]|uniref:Uncharacterized protein n=1 Tax=Colletotrichum spaethianum TaxID=700344 RepID=A0AA37P674_9PEZI|nr:uncharacterized protein ColSpa_05877 [Colletotrichum spaethianum]GKT45696.1 hypothetical protein ColSpa_05877 [Colletotrichum spaethianum]